MKLAICNNNSSFSKSWIEFCENQKVSFKLVNPYSNDIVKEVDDCNVFLWHHQQSDYKDLLFAKELLFALENAGKVVYPNFKTGWHFDDKVAQKYLLEAIDAPTIPSYVFYTKREATLWAKSTNYPVVFKLRGGAGGSNVKLVKDFTQNKKIINKSFNTGHSGFSSFTRFSDSLKLYKQKKVNFKYVLKSMARIIMPNPITKLIPKEIGYVYYQDFLPNNEFDIRLIIIGGKKAYGMKRLVRKGDFRASGSKNFVYDKIENEILKIGFEVSKKLDLQSVAFDFIYDENKKPRIVEISYGFGTSGSSQCKGYWDDNLNWYEGDFEPLSWILEDIICNNIE